MIDLIRKRHAGDGWIVFEELANGTGSSARRWADAAALGVWPSHGYELHGYEIKATRGDLQRELVDPTKADGVGRYCHFWWLVIPEEKVMDGLVVPKAWGILVPKRKVLRAVRKAPLIKRPRPFDASFVAAMCRNVTKTWVPKHEHEQLHDVTYATALRHAKEEILAAASDEERALRELRDKVEKFKAASGIDIQGSQPWEIGDVARAVKVLVRAHRTADVHPGAADLVRQHAHAVEHFARRHQEAVGRARVAAAQLTELADRLEADENTELEEPTDA